MSKVFKKSMEWWHFMKCYCRIHSDQGKPGKRGVFGKGLGKLEKSGKIEKNSKVREKLVEKNWSVSFLVHKENCLIAIKLFLVILLLENFSILNFLFQFPFVLVNFFFWNFHSLILYNFIIAFSSNYVLAFK